MAPRPLTFRQRDLTAALKAARDAGMTPTRVEIDRGGGKIALIFGDTPRQVEDDGGWDALIKAATS